MESHRLYQSWEKLKQLHSAAAERIDYLEAENQRLAEDRGYLLVGIIVITFLAFF